MIKNPILRKLWNNYKSIWFGMFLLATIMGVCIYGTVFYAANSSLGANAIPLAKDKIFYAWWFMILLAFFFIQFTISTWRVTKMSVTLWKKKSFKRSVDSMSNSKSFQELDGLTSVDEIEGKLGKKFTFVHRDGNSFFAHKGILSRVGPTIIHTGIVIILLTGITQILLSRLGNHIIVDEGRFAALEGESLNYFFTPQDQSRIIDETNIQSHEIESTIKVHDFDEIKHANADVPSYYSSLLEITDSKTGKIKFVRVDMNHSVNINGYQFHQASFQPVPPIQDYRMNYDVRRGDTGERVAIVDLSPGTKSLIGETDYMIEVDGEQAGDEYRIFNISNPFEPIITGVLSAPSNPIEFSLKATRVIPDFALEKVEDGSEETPQPYSKSNIPRNPALFIDILENGAKVGQTVLFMDQELNEIVNEKNEQFRFDFADIKAVPQPGNETYDFETFDWEDPTLSLFVINVYEKDNDELLQTMHLALNEPSESITIEPENDIAFPTADQFVIVPAGRTLKYATILSVVKDPVTHYYTIGVGLIFIGAMMTFLFRYLALYGIWNPDTKKLAVELQPRFGNASKEEIKWIETILKKTETESKKTLSVPKPTV